MRLEAAVPHLRRAVVLDGESPIPIYRYRSQQRQHEAHRVTAPCLSICALPSEGDPRLAASALVSLPSCGLPAAGISVPVAVGLKRLRGRTERP